MKAADYYVRGRHFFGFLVPGAVWTTSAVMLIYARVHPLDLLRQAPGGWVATAAFLFTSYVVGRGADRFSRGFAQAVWRRMAGTQLAKEQLADPEQTKALEDAVWRLVERSYLSGADLAGLKDAEKKHAEGKQREFPGPLFVFCKMILRERSSALRLELDDKEEEVNFFWMLPLPLIVLTAVVSVVSVISLITGSQPDWGVVVRSWLLISTAAAAFALIFCFLLGLHQQAERLTCYFLFVTLHVGPGGLFRAEGSVNSPPVTQEPSSAGDDDKA